MTTSSGYLCTAELSCYLWQHGADALFLSCAAREQFVGCVLCAPVACRCEYWTSQYVRLFTVSWHTKRARCSPALVSTLTLTWISENTPVCAACRNPAPSNERSPAGFVVVFWPEQAGAHGANGSARGQCPFARTEQPAVGRCEVGAQRQEL